MNAVTKATPVLGRRQVLAGFAATALSACTSTTEPTYSTQSMTDLDPLARFRIFADAGSDVWSRHLQPPQSASGPCVLALSGGGEDGAFGAGALVGWTKSGERPMFDMVTGTSTGALIAPFAFLGPDCDEELCHIFTQYGADDIMKMRPLQAAFSDALYDTTPLAKLIEKFTPPELIAAIAERHAAGARLFFVTSELDSARASVWDMGAIAQAGETKLFRGVMRASAALPGLFPPVTVKYAVGNKTYSETHIDGGVHMQFLAIPDYAFKSPDQTLAGGSLYLLINNTLDPAPINVSRSALAISQQALTTSVRASARASVNATTLFAHANHMDLSVASVDPEAGIVYDPSDRFSSVYMNALYAHGFERGSSGTLWSVA